MIALLFKIAGTFSLLIFLFGQEKTQTFFIVDKGVYVKLQESERKVKVPYKKGLSFYFILKDDSTAFIQEVRKKKLVNPVMYRLKHSYDTVYLKRYTFDSSGNSKLALEKVIFRSVLRK